MQVPVTDGQQLLVSHDYLRHLVKLANQKMEANWARVERFHALFRQQFLFHDGPGRVNGGEQGSQGGVVVGIEQKGRAADSAHFRGTPGKEKAAAAQTTLYLQH